MYYLTQINGKMISGAIITKQPPTKGLLEAIHESAQDKKTIPPDKLVVITPLTYEDLCNGAGIVESTMNSKEFTEENLIRKYLDNLNKTK